MSPTARTTNYEGFPDDDCPVVRTSRLEASELQALYGGERGYTCPPVDVEHHKEEDEECPQELSMCGQSMLGPSKDSQPPRGLQRRVVDTDLHRRVVFFNEAYYTQLEELKRAHLKNIADLEKLYLSQLTSWQRDRPLDTLLEEADSEQVAPGRPRNVTPHCQLIDSDQSDASVDECVSEQRDERNTHSQQRAHVIGPPELLLQWKCCPSHSPTSPQGCPAARRRNSKVTVPQPFRMTLREEQRRLRRVKTRSEVELENELLRKELDELKECGKKFRATPAPASTHAPLYEVLAKHHTRRTPAKEATKRHATPRLLPQPFSFIERERKKKERKLEVALSASAPREECRVFRARPVPRSIYRRHSHEFLLYGAVELHGRDQEQSLRRPGSVAPPSSLEESQADREKEEGRGWGERKWSMEKVEREMERKRNGDRDWSYIHPLRRASLCHSQEALSASKTDYISV